MLVLAMEFSRGKCPCDNRRDMHDSGRPPMGGAAGSRRTMRPDNGTEPELTSTINWESL
jgi:hypothetical protein